MEDRDRFEMYERVHLRSNTDRPDEEKVSKLKNKHRSKWIQIVFNIVVILGLAYGFLAGYRPFSEWVYYVLIIIFAINMVLLYVQKNQISELSAYLKNKMKSDSSVS